MLLGRIRKILGLRGPVRLLLLSIAVAETMLDNAVKAVENMTPILSVLVTIIVLIALPILVFKVLTKAIIDKI